MKRVLTHILITLLCALAAFQLLLALGAPQGAAAWGGAYAVLPTALRWGNLASAFVFGLALLVVLEKLGVVRSFKRPRLVNGLLLGLAGLFALSAVTNLFSPSPWERFLMFPVATAVCAACLRLGPERRVI